MKLRQNIMIKSHVADNVENYHLQEHQKFPNYIFLPLQDYPVNINLLEQAIIQLSSHLNYLNVQVIIAFISY